MRDFAPVNTHKTVNTDFFVHIQQKENWRLQAFYLSILSIDCYFPLSTHEMAFGYTIKKPKTRFPSQCQRIDWIMAFLNNNNNKKIKIRWLKCDNDHRLPLLSIKSSSKWSGSNKCEKCKHVFICHFNSISIYTKCSAQKNILKVENTIK